MSDEDRIAQLEQRIAQIEQRRASQPTPWYWKNPIANKMAQGAVLSTKTAVIQESAGLSGADFTTTGTGAIELVMTVNIRIIKGRTCIFGFASFGVKHSAIANFDAYLMLNDGIGLYVLNSILGIYLATADKVLPVHLSCGLDVKANLIDFGFQPGDRALQLWIQNNTAGTLTVPGVIDNAPLLHGFVTGDSSS